MKKLLGILIIGLCTINYATDYAIWRQINVQRRMNKENASKLWKMIQEAGDYLEGQLPDHPNHPKGRNPYAHVAICVKSKFNASYKDIDDEKFEEVIKYIEFLKNNPS